MPRAWAFPLAAAQALAIVLLAQACAFPWAGSRRLAGLAQTGRTGEPALAADPGAGTAPGVSARTGAIVVTVRWPAGPNAPDEPTGSGSSRTLQAIPAQTSRIDVATSRPGDALMLGEAILERATGATESTAVFADLAPGPLLVSAIARDATGSVLAAGAAQVTVHPNEVAGAQLSLNEAFRPAVVSVSPEKALPGNTVLLAGTDLASASAASISIAVGGVRLAPGDISVTPEGLVSFIHPAGATTSHVLLSIGGVPVKSPGPIATIASLSLTPAATVTFAPSGLVRFKVRAFDTAGQDLGDPLLALAIAGRACNPAPCAGQDEVNLLDLVVGSDTGNLVLGIGSGNVAASAAVTVHLLVPANFPGASESLGPLPTPNTTPTSPGRVALGKQLFFDPKLSRTGTFSCATCHNPAKGWSDGRAKARGSDFSTLPRNTLSVLDAGYMAALFWDGRATSLEAAVTDELKAPKGINADTVTLLPYLATTYGASFSAEFGHDPDLAATAGALASFLRALASPATTPFDRWLAGETAALAPEAFRGLGVFLGKAQCANCHFGPLFTDGKFHNIGLPGSGTTDFGRILVSGDMTDLGAFRTSGLRNVALSAPYFHDGSKANLEAAIKHYTTFAPDFPNLSPLMPAIRVSGQDVADLETFLRTLTATPSY